MSERNGSLSPDQLRAVGVLAGADPADVADCDSEAVADWLRGDPEFIAELNRVRSYGAERLRADVRSLASDAMATLRRVWQRFETKWAIGTVSPSHRRGCKGGFHARSLPHVAVVSRPYLFGGSMVS